LRTSSVISNSKPVRLPVTFKAKVWGRTDLSPWYPNAVEKIGEAWFEADLPLLVKFVFTSERLSVQVHPGDAFAALHEHSRGKTEMWHILKADPGAQIALGFRDHITVQRLEESARSGEIENLLQWIDVNPGDTFFVPSGTVHALGAGLTVCEIQQYSDVTYRLYDYGRPRELHLDKAIQVARTGPAEIQPRAFPVDCEYFHTDLLTVERPLEYPTENRRFHLLIVLGGYGSIAGEPYRQGEAWLSPSGTPSFEIRPARATTLLRTWVP
jgi:mannose-6-phosphate isomerase